MRDVEAGFYRKDVALSWNVKAFQAFLPETGIKKRSDPFEGSERLFFQPTA